MSSTPTVNQVIVLADAERNRIEIIFRGVIAASEMRRYEEDVRDAISQLRTEFHLLTDLSALTSMDAGCIPHMERSMDAINGGGVGRIVRVIPHTS